MKRCAAGQNKGAMAQPKGGQVSLLLRHTITKIKDKQVEDSGEIKVLIWKMLHIAERKGKKDENTDINQYGKKIKWSSYPD